MFVLFIIYIVYKGFQTSKIHNKNDWDEQTKKIEELSITWYIIFLFNTS